MLCLSLRNHLSPLQIGVILVLHVSLTLKISVKMTCTDSKFTSLLHILLHSNSSEKRLEFNKTMQERNYMCWIFCIYRLDHSGPWRIISPISLCSKSNLHYIFFCGCHISRMWLLKYCLTLPIFLTLVAFLVFLTTLIHAFLKTFIQSPHNVPTRNILPFLKISFFFFVNLWELVTFNYWRIYRNRR